MAFLDAEVFFLIQFVIPDPLHPQLEFHLLNIPEHRKANQSEEDKV